MCLKKCIYVSILYFNLGLGNDYIYYGTTEFYGVHTQEKLKVKRKITNINKMGNEIISYKEKENIFPEYHLINVEKFKDIVEEDMDEWIYMLKNSEIKKEFKSKYIKEAEESLRVSMLNENERRQYEKYLETVAIERDIMSTAKEEGREEGREEGSEERAVKVAKNFLSMGLTVEQVAKGSELSVEKIIEIKNKM